MTALAIVIFNHILSRISRPESGSCITLTMVAMSVLLADRGRSSNSGVKKKTDSGETRKNRNKSLNATGQRQRWLVDHRYVATVGISCLYHSVGMALSRRWCEKSKQPGQWVSPVQLNGGRDKKFIRHDGKLQYSPYFISFNSFILTRRAATTEFDFSDHVNRTALGLSGSVFGLLRIL